MDSFLAPLLLSRGELGRLPYRHAADHVSDLIEIIASVSLKGLTPGHPEEGRGDLRKSKAMIKAV